MGCDIVVALGHATVDGQTLFGINSDHAPWSDHFLCHAAAREFAAGEKVQTQYTIVPQVRRTYSVWAIRPEGWWGYDYGVNQHSVVVGHSILRTMFPSAEAGLTGGDLVRLALERAENARHAVECLTGLVERHGQTASPGQCGTYGSDHAFLIADAVEAFAVETAGRHWVYQEMHEVRAASNASVIHQDWDWISRGLAGNAIDKGWWPGDGSKLDFAGTLSRDPMGQASGLRRWGRATFLLEQQNGHIDLAFLRRLLSDHYEGTHYEMDPDQLSLGPVPLCQHGNCPDGSWTRSSFIAQLSADSSHLPMFWWAIGPPCQSIYFPVLLEGELPVGLSGAAFATRLSRLRSALSAHPRIRRRVQDHLGHLQASFDREAEQFAEGGAAIKQKGDAKQLAYLAGTFMQHAYEQLELGLDNLEKLISNAPDTRGVLLSDL
jgi:secernin